jgi:cell division septum initiation protein DivIVA
MNNLKKSIMGKYNAADVDRLLLKVRNDYEQCLKEQKDRIITLRDENRELNNQLVQFRQNEQYIIGAITRAEETAQTIIAEAQNQAKIIVQKAKSEEKLMKTAVEGCYQKLCRLKSASEEIYRAVTKAVGEQEELEKTASNVRPFMNIYEGTHN